MVCCPAHCFVELKLEHKSDKVAQVFGVRRDVVFCGGVKVFGRHFVNGCQTLVLVHQLPPPQTCEFTVFKLTKCGKPEP